MATTKTQAQKDADSAAALKAQEQSLATGIAQQLNLIVGQTVPQQSLSGTTTVNDSLTGASLSTTGEQNSKIIIIVGGIIVVAIALHLYGKL
jgi:hypothetical protein